MMVITGARQQIFVFVFNGVDHVFHIRIRHANDGVAELFDDQFRGIRVQLIGSA